MRRYTNELYASFNCLGLSFLISLSVFQILMSVLRVSTTAMTMLIVQIPKGRFIALAREAIRVMVSHA